MNNATNNGKHDLKIEETLLRENGDEGGVSSKASGKVTKTNVTAAPIAIAIDAMPTSRVINSVREKATSATTDLMVNEIPARYSLSTCCKRPSYTSAIASTAR